MLIKWMKLTVGISLASLLINCVSADFGEQQVQITPPAQEQSGYLEFEASLDKILTPIRGDLHRREHRSRNQIAENIGLSNGKITVALLHADVKSNLDVQYQTTFGENHGHGARQENNSYSVDSYQFSDNRVNSEIYGGFLTSADLPEKIRLPASFEECENTLENQMPKPNINLHDRSVWTMSVQHAQFDQLDRDQLMPVFTMKHSSDRPVRSVVKMNSRIPSGSVGQSLANPKFSWYYDPPIGSRMSNQLIEGRHFDMVVDTVGEHVLALRMEDESGACAVRVVRFLSTANVPYQVPRVSRKALYQEAGFEFNRRTAYLDQIQGRASWKHSQGEGVTIAFLDSGLNYNHPLVAHNVKVNEGEIPGNGLDDDQNGKVDDYTGYDLFHDDPYPFDDSGHGSRVTGLGASALGLAQKARVLPVKVSGLGTFSIETLISAIYYAVDSGAQIINVSLVISSPHSDQGLKVAAENAIAYAKAHGVLIVAGAGNDGQQSQYLFPAGFPSDNIITVGAVDGNGLLAPYSNWGVQIDIAAPGGTDADMISSIYMYNPKSYLYSKATGTSLATSLVSGLAAQILSINPQLSPDELIDIIISTGDDSRALQWKVKSASVINALNAVLAAKKLRPSSDVYKLQIDLMRHCSNLPSNFADRRFGPATRAALKQFQASYGLTPDGIYGPKTADALNSPVTGACK